MLVSGALLMAAAVALGAIGSHALESYLNRSTIEEHSKAEQSNRDIFEKRLNNWDVAVRYQTYHALGLLVLALVARFHADKLLGVAFYFFLAGIFLFSGMLYAWVLTQNKFFVTCVPLGGVSFIVGWVCTTISFLRMR